MVISAGNIKSKMIRAGYLNCHIRNQNILPNHIKDKRNYRLQILQKTVIFVNFHARTCAVILYISTLQTAQSFGPSVNPVTYMFYAVLKYVFCR